MTRTIAIVGTSNIGALKYAASQIAADHPQFAVSFYGLPGGKFAEAAVDAQGRFQPPAADGATRKMAQKINGAEAIDLRGFDAVFVIADTLGMTQTLFLAAQYDVVDWPTRRGQPLLSAPGFLAAMHEAITERADLLARQFHGIAPLFTALAPYPSVVVTRRGAHRQEPYALVAGHPELARIHTLYREMLTAELAARAITFVGQPHETLAAPFLTKAPYAKGALDFRASHRVLDDHRHMNAAFGASLFRAFALALGPNKAGHTPTQNIKE